MKIGLPMQMTFTKTIGKYKPEDKVTITYKRAGKENKATVTLGENKQVKVFSWDGGDMG
jgi:serine protease Do